jgi:hypothetical protein
MQNEIKRLARLTYWLMYFSFIQLFFGITGVFKLEWTVLFALISFLLNLYYTHKQVCLEEEMTESN